MASKVPLKYVNINFSLFYLLFVVIVVIDVFGIVIVVSLVLKVWLIHYIKAKSITVTLQSFFLYNFAEEEGETPQL